MDLGVNPLARVKTSFVLYHDLLERQGPSVHSHQPGQPFLDHGDAAQDLPEHLDETDLSAGHLPGSNGCKLRAHTDVGV